MKDLKMKDISQINNLEESELIDYLNKNPLHYSYLNENNKNNQSVIKAVLKSEGLCLVYMSDEICNSEDYGLLAINQNPKSFKYLSERLRGEKEIFLSVFSNYSGSSEFVGKELLKDKDVVLKILKIQPYYIKKLSIKLQLDQDVIKLLVDSNYKKVLSSISKKIILNTKMLEKVLWVLLDKNYIVVSGELDIILENQKMKKLFSSKFLKNSNVIEVLSKKLEKQNLLKEIKKSTIKSKQIKF